MSAPILSRGVVLPGAPDEVAATLGRLIRLDRCSFTDDDELADAFASMDDDLEPGMTRVKLFLTGTPAKVEAGDEAEFIVTGPFTAAAEVTETGTVTVLLTPA